MAIGTVVGARLGHCFFYEPEYYLKYPWEIIQIWHGGLASHGAAIGILSSLLIFSLLEKRPYLWLVDRICIVVALSGFLIRMGNLMNSEIYGHETSLPWGFIFERAQPLAEIVPKHPTQIYEALAYLLIFAIVLWYYFKQKGKLKDGFIFGFFLASVFSARFLIEFIKNEQVDFEKTMAINMGQILSIPFIIAGVILIIYSLKKK
jgi:prolipoprotein diacylglyceryl transferase